MRLKRALFLLCLFTAAGAGAQITSHEKNIALDAKNTLSSAFKSSQRYHAAEGKFTNKFADLDVYFAGTKEDDGSVTTKEFVYTMTPSKDNLTIIAARQGEKHYKLVLKGAASTTDKPEVKCVGSADICGGLAAAGITQAGAGQTPPPPAAPSPEAIAAQQRSTNAYEAMIEQDNVAAAQVSLYSVFKAMQRQYLTTGKFPGDFAKLTENTLSGTVEKDGSFTSGIFNYFLTSEGENFTVTAVRKVSGKKAGGEVFSEVFYQISASGDGAGAASGALPRWSCKDGTVHLCADIQLMSF